MSKMAVDFKVGDLVWAKMKGFPNWPGRVIAPKPEVKRPANRKNQQFVFFFGSENYAWIPEESMHIYADNRDKFLLSQRIPRGYKEAIEAIEDALRAVPDVNLKTSDLPSIEDELAQIFPLRKDAPSKDYSRDSGRKKKKVTPPPLPVPAKATKLHKDRRSSAPPVSIKDRHQSSHDEQKKNGKPSTAGGRSGKDPTLSGKEGAKSTKKIDRGSAASKVLHKSAKLLHKKKIRKIKPSSATTQSKTDTKTEEQTNTNDSSAPSVSDKDAKESNHTEDMEVETEIGLEEEVSFPETKDEALDAQAKSEHCFDCPDDTYDSGDEVKACSSGHNNGPQQIDDELEQAPTTSEALVEEDQDERESNCCGADSNGTAVVALPQMEVPATPTKEPSSARSENIFELFSQKDCGRAPVTEQEELDDGVQDDEEDEDKDEEDDEDDDDGVEYAVVTVDPDGQAHVLLNAETIIDDEVVVLGQEEEVETEGMEGDVETAPSVEVLDREEDVAEKVEEVKAGTEIETNGAEPSGHSDTEAIDLKKDTAIPEDQPPTPELPQYNEHWDQDDQVELESEAAGDTEPTTQLECEVLEDNIEIHTEVDMDIHAKAVKSVEAEIVTETVKVEGQGKAPVEVKNEVKGEQTDINTESGDGGQSEGLSEGSDAPPSRRSRRTRIRKEEDPQKDKTKKEPEEQKTSSSGRKLKDTPKSEGVKSLAVRRQSAKRPASPNSISTAKRSKMASKIPASPGRSVAPTEERPRGGVPLDTLEPAVGGSAKGDIIPTPLKIGFLGLGIMGAGMVDNLLKSGHEVTVWNRTAQKCREFMKEGALKGNTPAEVVAACDVTFSCVSDPAAVKDLVFGNCGVLQGIQPGKGYVEMSTIDPDTVADVQEAVTSQGGRFLEAPVVGSRGPAATGQLVILAAGDRMLYEDCSSCFKALGKKTFFLGETTSGCKMKLVVNMLMGTCVAGLAESLALADKVGLDQDALLQILDLSVMSCPLIRSKGQSIMMSRFEPQFPLQHQQKDLRLSINMADSVDQPLHVIAAVNELFKKAKAKGYSQHDMCAVYRAADM